MKLKPIKPNNFLITKAQMTLLMDIGLSEITPTLFTNRDNLELQFVCYTNNYTLNRRVMLALLHKHLIRYEYSSLCMRPTKLGIRMLKIKARNPNKSGIVYVPEKLIKSSDLIIATKTLKHGKI